MKKIKPHFQIVQKFKTDFPLVFQFWTPLQNFYQFWTRHQITIPDHACFQWPWILPLAPLCPLEGFWAKGSRNLQSFPWFSGKKGKKAPTTWPETALKTIKNKNTLSDHMVGIASFRDHWFHKALYPPPPKASLAPLWRWGCSFFEGQNWAELKMAKLSRMVWIKEITLRVRVCLISSWRYWVPLHLSTGSDLSPKATPRKTHLTHFGVCEM